MAKPNRQAKSPSPIATQKARVIGAFGRNFWVQTDTNDVYQASRRGKKGDVTVGDWVTITEPVSGEVAIQDVLPRESLFFRSDEWRTKTLAANIDQVAIVFASRPTFNPWFIWKAIVAAQTQGITVFAIRNKADLVDMAEEADIMTEQLQSIGIDVMRLCAQEEQATREALIPRLTGHKTLFVGQSGMGKSTLLNALIPSAQARTREFSEALDLGKQTTTAARWYEAHQDGWEGVIVDSPGFQEFGLAHITIHDVIRAMPDILPYADQCRFLDCRHEHEPDCGVKRALEEGLIAPARYDFYLHMLHLLNPRP